MFQLLAAPTRQLWILVVAVGATSSFGKEPIVSRISGRDYPSIFQAWNPAESIQGESQERTEARHDLLFHDAGYFWLHWDHKHHGLAKGFTDDSIRNALARRKRLLKANPNMIMLCEIRYRDAHESFLPKDHEWWMRDDRKQRVVGWAEGNYYLLDDKNPSYRKHVVSQAVAAVRTGVVDGVMLDWWKEDDARVALVHEMRNALGDNALILVNSNDERTPRSATYINGLFMECYRSSSGEEWKQIAATLTWAEKNLREPRINCLETWFEQSRQDLQKMRATTTLALTHTDGYVLFSDPNDLPTPDHLHDWYPFWDAPLGKPLDKRLSRIGSATLREFEHGVVVFNPPGKKTVTVKLPANHKSIRQGSTSDKHEIPAGDGDILIRQKP